VERDRKLRLRRELAPPPARSRGRTLIAMALVGGHASAANAARLSNELAAEEMKSSISPEVESPTGITQRRRSLYVTRMRPMAARHSNRHKENRISTFAVNHENQQRRF
jgi:hypothetical protein